MAERLAFERGTTRLYEALLARLDADDGSRYDAACSAFRRFRDDEAAHFQMLCEAIESLGGDALAPASSDSVIASQSTALLRAVEDPRASIAECLHMLLAAELSDEAGWAMLLELARASGLDALVERCQSALSTENDHVAYIKGWTNRLASGSLSAARAA